MASIINLIKNSISFNLYENEGVIAITADDIVYKIEGKNVYTCQTFIEDNLHFSKKMKSFSIYTRWRDEHDNKNIIFPKSLINLTLPNMVNLDMNKLKNIEYLYFDSDDGLDDNIINNLPKKLKELNIQTFYGYKFLFDKLQEKCEELGINLQVSEEEYNYDEIKE